MELTGNVQGLIDLVGGGSDVDFEQILESGEKIAVITIDNVPTDIYAPAGSEVEVTQVLSSGTKIASIEVDGESVNLYAPTPDEPTSVEVTQVLSSGTKIASITVDDTPTDIYAPEGGSDVEVTQVVSSGTKIATITVDDTPTDIYAPEGGGGVVYSQTPHKVGKYVENNVEYDVWEVMLLYGAQYYGEEQHNLAYLNIYKMLDIRGSIKMNRNGGNWGYYSPFYLSNSLYDNYRWDVSNKILITSQATDMYGKVDSRMITIRYIENVS